MTAVTPDPGSFRDPGGQVFSHDGRIFRSVKSSGAASYAAARSAGCLDELVHRGLLLAFTEVHPGSRPVPEGTVHLLEHPRIPFVSYPYEWSFPLHKAAALLHLDVHLAALEHGLQLIDASAFNVQFLGTRPVFIDHLSFMPYTEGMIWEGHRQFCNQFLNPLIMWSRLGVPPNDWFRGSLDGIKAEDLAPLLPWRQKLSWTVATHVIGQATLNRRAASTPRRAPPRRPFISRNAILGMLSSLRRFIEALTPPRQHTVWAGYSSKNSYSNEAATTKYRLVHEMVRASSPQLVFDIGCNSGDYSQAALDAGAAYVVGFDSDHGSLDMAYQRFEQQRLACLPLLVDLANPSPAQGWAQHERKGLSERSPAGALIALALVHHLAIGRNIPLPGVVHWLMSLAPVGIIEFPAKSDPMVQTLLATRRDVFPDYCEEAFLRAVTERGRIVKSVRLEESGRLLVWFEREHGAASP